MDEQKLNELRQKAEEKLAGRERQIEGLDRADLASLAHELSVHQVELEIQNEELRRSRLEAESARDRYLDLYDFAPVGYLTIDEHGRIVEANLTVCQLLKVERSSLLNTVFTRYISAKEAEHFYFYRKKVLETDTREIFELKMRRSDGVTFDAQLEGLKNCNDRIRVAVTDITGRKQIEGELSRYRGHLEEVVKERTQELIESNQQLKVEIEERKKAEQSLRASEEEFRNLVENAPVGIAIVTYDGHPILRNRAIAMQSGYSEQELTEIPVDKRYLNPEDRQDFLELAQKGIVRNFETRLKRKDGSFYWASLTAIPQETRAGRGLITIIEDITERKHAEEQLKTFPIKLIEAQEKERRAIGRELHDQTGQYLTALKLLLAKLGHDVPQAESGVREATEITSEVLLQVRELSMRLHPPLIDESGLVPALIWQFEKLKAQTGLKIHFEQSRLGEKSLPTDISLTAFRIIQEALTNVLRYSGVSEAAVKIKATRRKLSFSIEDKGKGFDLQEAANRESSGLINMRERAALVGGVCTISSAPGKGTTVTVELPIP